MALQLPDRSNATVVYFNRTDVFAALTQSAEIAEREGFPMVAKRCYEMASFLRDTADRSTPIIMVL